MSRRLRPDEVELWNKVAGTAERINRPKPKSEVKPGDTFRKPVTIPADPLPSFQIGARAKGAQGNHDLRNSVSDQIRSAPLRKDRKTHTKMKRGKLVPEARIDLHGMTMDRAHPSLTGFIMRAASEGKRLVLVITGKGKDRDDEGPIPIRRGVLRHQVPHWLSVPPLSQLVLQITAAHDRHGGGGAYYVYLKRLR